MLHVNKKLICSPVNLIDPLDVCFRGNFLLKNTNINVKNIKYNYYPKIKVDWNCSLFQIFFLGNDKIENYLELEPSHKLYV
jgi:hypothetical protein